MKLPFDARFREEAERFAFRFNCEDCVHFDGRDRCVHGFPLEKHRRKRYEDGTATEVELCKEFELL